MSTIDPLPPSGPPPLPPRSSASGSLGAGVGFAWAVIVGGYVVCFMIFAATGDISNGETFVLALLLP